MTVKILFHVGVGNLNKPERWNFVCDRFSTIARTLDKIDSNIKSLLYVHPKAVTKNIYVNNIISNNVDDIDFVPDIIFTWNGNNIGDKILKKKFSGCKFIYGELTLFDRHNTTFFDPLGIGVYSSLFLCNHSYEFNNSNIIETLKSKYIKPRLVDGNYIFVPLQNPLDIDLKKCHASLNSLEDLIQFAYNKFPKHKIIYKEHPYFRFPISNLKNNRIIKVNEDCHHFIPYADFVVGINSGVLIETLIYHSNVISLDNNTINYWDYDKNKRNKILNGFYNTMIPNNKLSDDDFINNSYLMDIIKK